MNNKKYIYNPEQAKFYVLNGAIVIDTGVNQNTNKIYWVFGYDDTKEVYQLWLNNKNYK
jgi:hypothetical protein